MRSILRPAFSASSRHRCRSFSNALSSTASFFNGWRSTPGTIPATSQLDRLISMTEIKCVRFECGHSQPARQGPDRLFHPAVPAISMAKALSQDHFAVRTGMI
jgi:hypothetical protein